MEAAAGDAQCNCNIEARQEKRSYGNGKAGIGGKDREGLDQMKNVKSMEKGHQGSERKGRGLSNNVSRTGEMLKTLEIVHSSGFV
ncbi:hypothetical protein E2C01_029696 [Portunus trituberculatus]|uniref:Uncharacterized protein n=1 Tax=Portunus trituberculatus TaxID=210409 RepID=A0A5B7ES63_PORTR|nr:hypothetical protein [Portunus trituberculatus]